MCALGIGEGFVALAGDGAFAGVGADGSIYISGASVVQVGGGGAESPERRGAEFIRAGVGLRDAVAEGAHVVQQQVGV